MVVQHNLQAMNSNRMLGITQGSLSKSTEKLSSGYKINRAADDAAGLSISEKMRKQIRGLTQASLNAEDGISAVQTAEGALNEVQDMLQRMNELAVKAANGTNSADDRQYIQDEIDQLIDEIDRVSETTKFNETYLLKGDKNTSSDAFKYVPASEVSVLTSNSPLFDVCGNTISSNVAIEKYEAGETLYKSKTTKTAATDAADTVLATRAKVDLYDNLGHVVARAGDMLDAGVVTSITSFYTDSQQKTTAAASNLEGVSVANKTLYDAEGNVVAATHAVITEIDGFATINNYYNTVALGQVAVEGTDYEYDKDTYTGQLYDKDGNKVAENGLESYFEEKDGVLTYKGGLFTEGGKEIGNEGAALTKEDNEELSNYVSKTTAKGSLKLNLHVGADATENNQIAMEIKAMDTETLGISEIRVDGEDDTNARDAIDTIKAALQKVSTQRSSLGAIQNRLEHTINNLDNVVENTTAAESQIRDTDMATEMVKYSNNNILAQAGQAMLAQANQANQGVLSLIQ